MELRLGEMTNAELAEWFGIKERSFKNSKAKKLEILKLFADFREEKGKVVIIRIYNPIFSKVNNYAKVKQNVPMYWDNSGLDTCKHVGQKIASAGEIELVEDTIVKYVVRSRNELFGRPGKGGGEIEGASCRYVWCKRFGEGVSAVLEPLTEDEQEMKTAKLQEFYTPVLERMLMLDNDEEFDVEEDFEELKAERSFAYNSFMTSFNAWLTKKYDKPVMLVKGTEITYSKW